MRHTTTRAAYRVAAAALALVSFAVLTGRTAPAAGASPMLHVTNLPTGEATISLIWRTGRPGSETVHATVSGTASRHLQVWRAWNCPADGSGVARLATTKLRDGSAVLRNVGVGVRAIQTSCTDPQPSPQLTVTVTRSGSSAGVSIPVTVGSNGSWTNAAAPFRSYTSATYDGESCQRSGPDSWTVTDSFTIAGGTYELLGASTTGNGAPDITPQLTNTPVGYSDGPSSLTFTIRNVYPFDPSGLSVAYRICPNQDEAYVDVDFAFPDGSYAGEWELTHAWPASIAACG